MIKERGENQWYIRDWGPVSGGEFQWVSEGEIYFAGRMAGNKGKDSGQITESLIPLETGCYSADYGDSSKDFKQRVVC